MLSQIPLVLTSWSFDTYLSSLLESMQRVDCPFCHLLLSLFDVGHCLGWPACQVFLPNSSESPEQLLVTLILGEWCEQSALSLGSFCPSWCQEHH